MAAGTHLTITGARRPSDLKAFTPILEEALSFDPARTPHFYANVGASCFRLARRAGEVVAGYALYPVAQWFGGRAVGTAAIAAVAVATHQRGSGLGAALMKDALVDAARRRLPLATLYPATYPVYRRAGFEAAGTYTLVRLPPAVLTVDPDGAKLRPMRPKERAIVVRLEADRGRSSQGALVRNAWLWKRLLENPMRPVRTFVLDGPTGPEGYVAYQQVPTTSNHYEVVVRDWVAATPSAARGLLGLFARHRSMADAILLPVAPAEPLLLHLRETPAEVAKRIHWMLRIVDAKGALEARGYPAGLDHRLDLEIDDPLVPSNAGRFTLDIHGGRARVARGGRGTLRIHVRGLAALYSSHMSAHALAVAGLAEGSAGVLEAASAAFAGPPPWMAEIF